MPEKTNPGIRPSSFDPKSWSFSSESQARRGHEITDRFCSFLLGLRATSIPCICLQLVGKWARHDAAGIDAQYIIFSLIGSQLNSAFLIIQSIKTLLYLVSYRQLLMTCLKDLDRCWRHRGVRAKGLEKHHFTRVWLRGPMRRPRRAFAVIDETRPAHQRAVDNRSTVASGGWTNELQALVGARRIHSGTGDRLQTLPFPARPAEGVCILGSWRAQAVNRVS